MWPSRVSAPPQVGQSLGSECARIKLAQSFEEGSIIVIRTARALPLAAERIRLSRLVGAIAITHGRATAAVIATAIARGLPGQQLLLPRRVWQPTFVRLRRRLLFGRCCRPRYLQGRKARCRPQRRMARASLRRAAARKTARVRAGCAELRKLLSIHLAVTVLVERGKHIAGLLRGQHHHLAQLPDQLVHRQRAVIVVVEAVEEGAVVGAAGRVRCGEQLRAHLLQHLVRRTFCCCRHRRAADVVVVAAPAPAIAATATVITAAAATTTTTTAPATTTAAAAAASALPADTGTLVAPF